jgi:hypothetical protein
MSVIDQLNKYLSVELTTFTGNLNQVIWSLVLDANVDCYI